VPIQFALHELDAVRDADHPGAAPGPIRLPFSPTSGAASGAYVAAAGEGSGARLRLSLEPSDGAAYLEPARLSRDSRDPVLVLGALGKAWNNSPATGGGGLADLLGGAVGQMQKQNSGLGGLLGGLLDSDGDGSALDDLLEKGLGGGSGGVGGLLGGLLGGGRR